MSILKNFLRTDWKCKRKFIYNFGYKGLKGFKKFEKRKKNGEIFPAFQFISITNDCNLTCQGCWVNKNGKADNLDINKIHQIINESRKYGSYFFGILGGEPLMYKQIFEIFEKHQDCYFQLFTNGTLLNETTANELRKLGNVTPLISFEGNEQIADIRRGSNRVYHRTIQAIENATKNKLITGVAISVCKSNIDMALSDEFIEILNKKGVLYLWYYIYRPVGVNPCYELALNEAEIEKLRIFLVEGRKKYPLILIDSYWGADGEAFCPAAEGLSHHINPSGKIEPCPVIQYSCDTIEGNNLKDKYEKSSFLKNFKSETQKLTKGCILMENPLWLANFADEHNAENTSNNSNMPEQLKQAKPICSHGSCKRIPEQHRLYRFAKKRAFFGLGAYG